VAVRPHARALIDALSPTTLARLTALPSFDHILRAIGIEPTAGEWLLILVRARLIAESEADRLVELIDPPRPPARPVAPRVFVPSPSPVPGASPVSRVFAAFAPSKESDLVTEHRLKVSVPGRPDVDVVASAADTIVDEAGATVPGALLGSYPALAVLTISHRAVNATGESEPGVIEFTVPADPVVGAVPGAPDPLRAFAPPE
jgi:hypothetical protein